MHQSLYSNINLKPRKFRYFVCTKELSSDFEYCSEIEFNIINKFMSDFPVSRILSLDLLDDQDLSNFQSKPLPRDEVNRLNSGQKI